MEHGDPEGGLVYSTSNQGLWQPTTPPPSRSLEFWTCGESRLDAWIASEGFPAELLQDLSSLDVDLRARVTLNVYNQRKSIRCMAAYFHTSIKQLIGKTEKLMGHIHVLWHGHCYVVKCLHSQGVRHTTRRNHRHPTQGRDFLMWHMKCHSVSAPIESIRGKWLQCVHPHG